MRSYMSFSKLSARQVVVASQVVGTCSGSLISPRHVLTAVRLLMLLQSCNFITAARSVPSLQALEGPQLVHAKQALPAWLLKPPSGHSSLDSN